MTITINLFWILVFSIIIGAICLISFLFHNGFSLNLFAKHDQKVIDAFLEKYPDVTEIFCRLPLREQNIENNQEIHEINKRLDAIEKRLNNG
jgi:hypothetical protein